MIKQEIFDEDGRFILVDLKDKKYYAIKGGVTKFTEGTASVTLSVKFSALMNGSPEIIKPEQIAQIFDISANSKLSQMKKMKLDIDNAYKKLKELENEFSLWNQIKKLSEVEWREVLATYLDFLDRNLQEDDEDDNESI